MELTVSPTEIAAQKLGSALLGHQMMLSCAESCTGGLLGAAITAISGSSQWFERGYITYSNTAKQQDLRVNADTLNRFGAVSEQTAMEMAMGVLGMSAASDIAISTTGIAGPTGESPGKPVGMVCFGFARRAGDGIVTRAFTEVFDGDRQAVREQAVLFALAHALELIEPNLAPPQPTIEGTAEQALLSEQRQQRLDTDESSN